MCHRGAAPKALAAGACGTQHAGLLRAFTTTALGRAIKCPARDPKLAAQREAARQQRAALRPAAAPASGLVDKSLQGRMRAVP